MFMRCLSIIFFVASITVLSCDGRNRKHKTNAEVLKENKLFNSFSEQIKYIPEQHTEVITDTILNTGFHIKTHYYALENDYSSKTVKASDNKNKISHFKNFEAQFQISKNNNLVAQNLINKERFYKFESPDFWKSAIMQFVWVDHENSTEDFVTLITSFNIPETEVYKDFSIVVDAFGKIKIRAINLVENIL